MSDKIDIQTLAKRLEKASILNQFPKVFVHNETIDFTNKEVSALVSYASILSLGEAEKVNRSYKVITQLLEHTNGRVELVKAAAEVILSRIGNFPGRELLRQRYSLNRNIPAPLHLEIIAREAENTICDDRGGEIQLTDFQVQLFNSLRQEQNLSISAPTSAGKSFVLNLSLSEQINSRIGESIVYVVPTRALISEVSTRIRDAIKKIGENKAVIRTTPFPVDRDKVKSNVVYIFTQERLLSFLSAKETKPHIDTLIIDEAHEIQNGKRGIILQTAIDASLTKFNNVKLLFASPLIDNPEYFLSLFNRTSNGKYFTEIVSPVAQNIILIDPVAKKTKMLSASILDENNTTDIGVFEIPFKLRGSGAEQIGSFSQALSSSDTAVISFSNTPKNAEDRAIAAAKSANSIDISANLKMFISFVRSEIHPNYALIDCLQKGIAFHYGNMPSLLRTGVENLFKAGDIKIIFCTSTLLQGVNLPAKHIIIENPRSGDEPMTRADFLNLAGRAGRLLHEFHGNVWCIRPNEWDSECYKGDKLQTISSSISNLMEDGGVELQKAMTSFDLELYRDDNKRDEANVAIGKLYNDYLETNDVTFVEKYRTDSNSEVLDRTVDIVKSMSITLPNEIIKNNRSLRPDHLESLYCYLNQQDALEEYYPINPYFSGSKARVEKILDILQECFEWKIHENYKPWLSFLAYQWVWGKPIGQILKERISYLEKNKPNQSINPSTEIGNCLRSLESDVRFKMVKYYSAYVEVLRYIAEKRVGKPSEDIEAYHIYLEFGSCKKSVLNLMSIGLSRFTALHLDKSLNFNDNEEPESYITLLKKTNIHSLKIPKLCIDEAIYLIS